MDDVENFESHEGKKTTQDNRSVKTMKDDLPAKYIFNLHKNIKELEGKSRRQRTAVSSKKHGQPNNIRNRRQA